MDIHISMDFQRQAHGNQRGRGCQDAGILAPRAMPGRSLDAVCRWTRSPCSGARALVATRGVHLSDGPGGGYARKPFWPAGLPRKCPYRPTSPASPRQSSYPPQVRRATSATKRYIAAAFATEGAWLRPGHPLGGLRARGGVLFGQALGRGAGGGGSIGDPCHRALWKGQPAGAVHLARVSTGPSSAIAVCTWPSDALVRGSRRAPRRGHKSYRCSLGPGIW